MIACSTIAVIIVFVVGWFQRNEAVLHRHVAAGHHKIWIATAIVLVAQLRIASVIRVARAGLLALIGIRPWLAVSLSGIRISLTWIRAAGIATVLNRWLASFIAAKGLILVDADARVPGDWDVEGILRLPSWCGIVEYQRLRGLHWHLVLFLRLRALRIQEVILVELMIAKVDVVFWIWLLRRCLVG